MALILKASGEKQPIVPALGKFPVEELLEIVNSPTIEVLPGSYMFGKKLYIVVDESGYEKDKPFNATASREAHKAVYGDALVARYEELGGEAIQ